MLVFIRDFMGEEIDSDSSSNSINESSKMNSSNTYDKSKKTEKHDHGNACSHKHIQSILIFDHASIMDEESCSLMLRVYQ
jgi:hypothetical protein